LFGHKETEISEKQCLEVAKWLGGMKEGLG
jgi:hypothetical protein